MKSRGVFWAMPLALAAVCFLMPMRSANAQGKRSGPGYQPPPPVTKTKLDVMEFSGEFQQWVKSRTITTAEKLTFRWSTNEAGVASATWMVSDKPASFSHLAAAPQAPHVIRSGNLRKAPAKGHITMFDIDFALFVSKKPPEIPRTYWVFLTTKNARNQPVDLASVPVKIVYRASTAQPVKFGECFKNADCYTGYFCNLHLNECRVIAYQCDGHFLRGSEGSKYDCSPYQCQAGQCLKSCASVDNCVYPPFVCTNEGNCAALPK